MRNTTATMRSIIRSIEKLIIFVATGEQYTLNFAAPLTNTKKWKTEEKHCRNKQYKRNKNTLAVSSY